jgi:hypothetical protein
MDLLKITQAINVMYAYARLAPLVGSQHDELVKAAQVLGEQLKELQTLEATLKPVVDEPKS